MQSSLEGKAFERIETISAVFNDIQNDSTPKDMISISDNADDILQCIIHSREQSWQLKIKPQSATSSLLTHLLHELCNVLKHNNRLNTFVFSCKNYLTSLKPENFKRFCQALQQNKIKILHLSSFGYPPFTSTWLSDQSSWLSLCQAIANSEPEELSFYGLDWGFCWLDNNIWSKFCQAITSSSVRKLSLTGYYICALNAEKMEELGKYIATSKIQSLTIEGVYRSSTWVKWCEMISASNITALDIGRISLYDLRLDDCKIFCQSLKKSQITHVEGLQYNLYNASIVKFIEEINEILRANKKILKLNKLARYVGYQDLNEINSSEQMESFLNHILQAKVINFFELAQISVKYSFDASLPIVLVYQYINEKCGQYLLNKDMVGRKEIARKYSDLRKNFELANQLGEPDPLKLMNIIASRELSYQLDDLAKLIIKHSGPKEVDYLCSHNDKTIQMLRALTKNNANTSIQEVYNYASRYISHDLDQILAKAAEKIVKQLRSLVLKKYSNVSQNSYPCQNF